MRPLSLFRFLTFSVALILAIGCAAVSTAQTDSDSDANSNKTNQNDLPEHAVWRHGDFGDSVKTLNGYYRISFSPDGKSFAARNQNNLLTLFRVEDQKVIHEFKGYEDRQWIQSIDFSPDSKLLLVACQGGNEKVDVWNCETGERHLELESDGAAAYFRNNETIVVLHDGGVTQFSSETGVRQGTEKWGNASDQAVTFSRDGKHVVSQRKTSRGRAIEQFALTSFDLETDKKKMLGTQGVQKRRATFSPDGNWLVSTFARENDVRIWNFNGVSALRIQLSQHEEIAESVCFSPDSRFIATTGWDGKVFIYETLTQSKLGVLTGHTGHVTASAFSPKDFLLTTSASGRKDCSIICWDYRHMVFPTGDDVKKLDTFDKVWSGLSSPNGHRGMIAVSTLVRQNEEYYESLVGKLGLEMTERSDEDFQAWIDLLGSPVFLERVKAEEQLLSCRLRADSILRSTLMRDDLVLEIRHRITRILKTPVERPKISQTNLRRLLRVIHALELSGDEKSRNVLLKLAESHDHFDVSKSAVDSLARLKAANENE